MSEHRENLSQLAGTQKDFIGEKEVEFQKKLQQVEDDLKSKYEKEIKVNQESHDQEVTNQHPLTTS